MHLTPGTILRRDKALGIEHVGVLIGPDQVFHSTPTRGEHISSIREFSGGQPVRAVASGVPPEIVLARVNARLARPQRYDLLSANCDHSATGVITGDATSPQLQAAAIAAMLAALAFMAFRN